MRHLRAPALLGAALAFLVPCPAQSQSADRDALWRSFLNPPNEARPMVRWWWFGPAVKPEEIDRQIRSMRAGGFGGFEVQPVYPLVPDGAVPGITNSPFLSDRFLGALRHAGTTARAEGMRVDVTLGSGWPFGGPHIGIDRAASLIRMERKAIPAGSKELMLPAVGPGESIVAAMIGPAIDGTAAPALAPLIITQPRVPLQAAAHPREALIFVRGRTGQQVKRPSIGAEGYVLDHLDEAAVATHIGHVGDRLLTAFAGIQPPDALFSDSLEAYGSSWTSDFQSEFQRRRGYDVHAHLPDLFLATPLTDAVRFDWARTLAELVDERYLRALESWAKSRGTRFRAQVYGIPPVTLSSNALVALPEGEGDDWRKFTSTRWATSAAHLYNRPVVSSEVWTWLHSPSWAATPLDMKVEADRHFLQGVTQLVGHGWPYTPAGVPEPGWAFYAAAALNDHNPWYGVMPDVTRYLQRVSHILRQGEPANAVAIYLPTEDAFATMDPRRASVNEWMSEHLPATLVPQVLDAGHGFDFIDAQAIAARGIRHRVMLLPPMRRIDPAAYRKVVEWVRQGGTLIVADRWPQIGGGLLDGKGATAAVVDLTKQLQNQSRAVLTPVSAVGSSLARALPGDVQLKVPDTAIGHIRRRLPQGDLYFVVNTSNTPVRNSARFAGDNGNGSWWDPMTGRRWDAGTGDVALTLEPYEARILTFAGTMKSAKAEPQAGSVPVRGPWTLHVPGHPPRRVEQPAFWTDDPKLRYFSGTAIYRTRIRLRAEAGTCFALDLGSSSPIPNRSGRNHGAAIATPVRDAAIIFVNGRKAGSLWAPPYRLDISSLLRSGENDLEVQVSNRALNALAGKPREDFRLLSARYGERFQMQEQDGIASAPSGLSGKVTIVTSRCSVRR